MRCGSRPRTAALLAAALLLAGCGGGAGGRPPAASTSAAVSAPVATPTLTVPDSSAVGTAPLPAPPSPALAAFYAQRLRWTPCHGGDRCATLLVPLSYAAPDIRHPIRLPVVDVPATSPAHRIGSLVVNPGGPGGSGYDYALDAPYAFTAAVRARYDIVGFDPRGVQGSRPSIACVSDQVLDAYIDAPADNANAAQQLALSRAFADGCARRSPALLANVGTRDAARDLDLLRAGLGEPKLDYLGKSYGTLLGITYAEEYPSRVGRMVLDGVLNPALGAAGLLAGQTAGFELAYRSFLGWCVRSGGCPLGTSVPGAYARTVSWVAGLTSHRLRTPGGRALTTPLAQLAILASMYEDRTQWPALRSAFRTAFAGSPNAMLAIGDASVDRTASGRFLELERGGVRGVVPRQRGHRRPSRRRPRGPTGSRGSARCSARTSRGATCRARSGGRPPRVSLPRSPPRASRRCCSSAPRATPPLPTRGRSRWSASSATPGC